MLARTRLLIMAALGLFAAVSMASAAKMLLVNGAGATFPYPIYSKWFSEYAKLNESVNFNYQSIGSGGGIKQLQAGTVDFGASDAPMSDDELSQANGKVLHFPTVMGGVVPTYSLPGNPQLNFSQATLAGIFLGKISNWDHPAIAKDNPNASLLNAPIVVVHRSDGSGTTYVFTDFLAKVSSSWKGQVGKGKSVNWPVGLGGKGNEGVAGLIKQTPNSIGYVELGYASQNHLPAGRVQGHDGEFVECTADTVSKAAAGALASMPEDFRVSIVNAPGADSYPISTFTWLLVYEKQTDRVKGEALVNFLKWMLRDGQKYTEPLGYAPLPSEMTRKEEEAIGRIQLP